MNFITKKSLLMKIIVSLFLVFFLFNTIIANYSYGFLVESILLKPLMSLISMVVGAGDAMLGLILGGGDTLDKFLNDDETWVNALASPEYIFAGEYDILNANLFSVDNEGTDTSTKIKKSVSKIYYSLVAICGVALLCLLIYTGIRIVLASNEPQEQSKWKLYLMDWIKSVCLLLMSHVIMIAIFYIVELISSSFSNMLSTNKTFVAVCAENAINMTQTIMKQLVFLIMFIYISYMTLVFAIAYFKRLIWTIVLIVIAPLVAVVYPLNGVAYDGKGVFKKWLKEFVMNAIIPVFHIIVYTVLIGLPLGTALNTTLFSSSGFDWSYLPTLMYCLIAMGMIRPAEKFIRKLFGIEGQVANQASFESGNRTISAGVKTAMAIASAAMTGGATAALATSAKAINPMMGDAVKLGINVQEYQEEKAKEDEYNNNKGEDDPDYERNFDSETVNLDEIENDNDNRKRLGLGLGLGEEEVREESIGGANDKLEEISDELEEINDKLEDNDNKLKDTKILPQDNGIKMSDLPEEEGGIREKLRNTLNKVKESNVGIKSRALYNSPEFKDSLMNLRGALHELTDSMYMPGDAMPDWQGSPMSQIAGWNIARNKERMKEKETQHINNKNNIQEMITINGLQDKYEKIYKYPDGTPNIEKAKEAAKEEAKRMLQKTVPYLHYGVNNVGTMNELLKYQKDKNCSPEDAIMGYSIEVQETKNISEGVKQYIINNNEKIQLGVNKQGNTTYFQGSKLNDARTTSKLSDKDLETIGAYIKERVDSAKSYREEGHSINTSLELSALEKKMKNSMIKLNKGESEKNIVANVYNVIEKAVKENKGATISLPQAKDNKNVENLQNFINTEIENKTKK